MEKDVIKIAKMVRKRAEEIATKEGFASDLCGLCARASAALHKELTKNGIKAKLHVAKSETWDGECHVFISVGNKIVDITATQFDLNNEDVKIIPMNKKDKQYYWKVHKTFNTVEDLINHQTNITRWPFYQTARDGDSI